MSGGRIRGVLVDLAGVVHVGDAPLPGAVEALERLRGAGLPLAFVTNTTSRPKAGILERLEHLGVPADAHDVVTPAEAARDWLATRGLRSQLLVAPALRAEFEGLDGDEGMAVVVGDAGEGFTYGALNEAFRALAGGAAFVALARNRTFRGPDGRLSLDAGAFVAALEYATGREAVLLGKPAPDFYAAALARIGLAGDAVAMIGDDVEADVSGALAAGIGHGLLVRTGKYAEGAEESAVPAPSAVLDDLAAAADWILDRT